MERERGQVVVVVVVGAERENDTERRRHSGCQSIGLQRGRDWGAFDLCLSKGEQREGPSRMIFLRLLAPLPL